MVLQSRSAYRPILTLFGVLLLGLVAWMGSGTARSGTILGQPAQIERGATNNLVLNAQIQLANKGFYRGSLDGTYGAQTAQAVMALHKYLGLERTNRWQTEDWQYLRMLDPIKAETESTSKVEVDLTRQLLFYQGRDRLEIIPISSGNGKTYTNKTGGKSRARTPTGKFRFYYHINGLRRSYLGSLWRPWYFRGGYAIHGSASVPAYPASHGCIRVPNWEANWLHDHLEIGMGVHIYYGEEVSPPELPTKQPEAETPWQQKYIPI